MNRKEMNELVQRQAVNWQRGDADAILADFAEDADFISPGGTWRGHAAIRQAVENFWDSVHSAEVQVDRVFGDGAQWAVEWRWSEVRRSDGQRHSADDAIIFTVNEQGKITYWREYFDTRNF
ncbi:MAG: nuclear transport factor 2 family protein [Caldilinea sp. CFX5]|nr:nuclear transport factor 2 family protein [Caldilinea sp. CFX5]